MTSAPEFPDAALRASRDAYTNVPVTLIDGALPPKLAGHLFVMSTCGTVDSGGAPYPNRNDRPTVINGDGMVWRFDFVAPAPGDPPAVTMSNAILKPPDYHYDELTRDGQPLDFAGFEDVGMLRASLFLGTRNYANTALVPMPDPGGGDTRLLCCYDAGPPVEIDPVSLETLDVVGQSWDPEALDGLVAFPPILATAHPMYDPDSGQLFASTTAARPAPCSRPSRSSRRWRFCPTPSTTPSAASPRPSARPRSCPPSPAPPAASPPGSPTQAAGSCAAPARARCR
jgi:carotenoid cleavage dioxygenase-like enzyme